jgi:two-component system, NarL family, response regulator LiaR
MIRIGIVEDLADYRNLLEMLIKHTQGLQLGFSAGTAEDALEGILMREINICMIDINLPGMQGPELVRWIRHNAPATLCLMCTAYDEDEKVFQSLQAGAHGYLLKSASPADIIDALQELHAGGSPMSSQVARKVVSSFNTPSTPSPSAILPELTDRENDILSLLAKGLLYKEIAAERSISIATVKRHCFNIYQKLHVKNRTEAINKLQ